MRLGFLGRGKFLLKFCFFNTTSNTSRSCECTSTKSGPVFFFGFGFLFFAEF